MAIVWLATNNPRAYAGRVPYTTVYCTASGTAAPCIKGIPVSLHEASAGEVFVGARYSFHEHTFPPRFQPDLKTAKAYVELMKD
jgi:hypothetical protein